MKRDLIPWLLTGALGASLSWNLWPHAEPPSASHGEPEDCTQGACAFECAVPEDVGLVLTPEQERELSLVCTPGCGRTEELEEEADAKVAQLWARLSAGEIDEEQALDLAREIGRLRGQALEACVTTVFRIRGLLSSEQLDELWQGCRTPPSGR